MNGRRRLDLSRQRNAGSLIGDAVSLVARNLHVFVAIAAAVVVPVQLIVFGVGLEQLWARYDAEPEQAEVAMTFVATYLVTGPLLAAMSVHAVLEAAEGRRPRAGRSIQFGLDAFARVFAAVALAAAGVALGLALFVVPGVYLLVRWYFVAQAVAIERRRGREALARSSELVRGSWWRVFALVLAIGLIAAFPAALVQQPLVLLAESTGRAAYALGGAMLAQVLAGPFVAVAATLLYFDLVVRGTGGALPPVLPPRPGGR